ncbi:MAG: hypothetical protein P0Y48_01130 [Candidatus Microbacterium phytovorans]|uniref:Uncharacterized protein n=1 Tax=Candidatus Microbacterium phytovorans TaxID=3121374 RepID=A0AAJ6B389_9MICO|nr:hypothetical protein [Microbacterium sp.]WEK13848.1 MAG: hypothetical protein P0Y48_01130 [Microbacterium sp.]
MPELSVEADPRLWSVVPLESEAEPWLRALLEGRTDEQQARILLAADLAVTAREAAPDSLVLLLCEPVSGLYATLGFLVTEAPAFRDAARAEELALTLTPSPWPPTTTPFTAGAVSGWRVTVLFSDEDAASDEQTTDGADASPVTPLGWVRTTYVLDLDDRLVVGQLSPLAPEAGAVALALTEQLLPTLEMDHRG